MPSSRPANAPIKLLIADVDGTLVNHLKALTPETIAAVAKLRVAGIAFALTSGRPPRGMAMLTKPLDIVTPLASFNGGMFVNPQTFEPIFQLALPQPVAIQSLALLQHHGLDAWLYQDNNWFTLTRHGPHVDREEFTVQFPPTVVPSFDSLTTNLVKIVGVSDDFPAVARAEADAQQVFGDSASATRSQPYYLDITPPQANKGQVVLELSSLLSIPTAQIATIGDGPNDVLMFRQSGLSIAMGNAAPDVQRAATFVTATNEQNGFAAAIHTYILTATR